MTLESAFPVLKWLAPLALSAGVSYGALMSHEALERDHNAQTRAAVERMQAAAPAEAAWHQHVDDRLDEQKHALDRIEHAVGSK